MRKIDTKANVLKRLKISNAKIPFLISFTEKDFLNRKKKILNKIAKIFKRKIAIRSSNASEDQEKNLLPVTLDLF